MLLLDTCTLLWLAESKGQLSPRAKTLIDENPAALYLSSISGFEISLLVSKKRLKIPLPVMDYLNLCVEFYGLQEIPVNMEIAIQANLLPLIHKDPADRIIIATAMLHKLTILTPDPFISRYPGIKTAW